MGDFLSQIKNTINGLSAVRKISMIAVIVIALGAVVYLLHLSNKTGYSPLFTNLNSDDIGAIVTQLDKQNVPYTIDADRKLVLVPSTQVLDLRMKLAGMGLPRYGGVGFELFDNAGFGMSEFQQKLNYQRALQGELSRTISGISEVEEARVHLVLPEKSVFSESQEEPRASIILKLGNGSMGRSQVASIIHLVSSAVEGLDPQQITVVDTRGHLLSAAGGEETAGSGRIFEQKKRIEKALETQVVSLLEPIIGLGKVVAKTTAEIDFSRLEEMIQKVDPNETVVLSESSTKSSSSGSTASAGGAAGASANLPGGAGGSSGASGSSADESTTSTKYDVTRITRKQIIPSGAIKKISMAVVVDGVYQDQEGEMVYVARSVDDLGKYESMVKSAIGFNTERGDVLSINSMQFVDLNKMFKDESMFAQRDQYSFIISIVVNVLIVIVALALFLFVIRPLIKAWREKNDAVEGADSAVFMPGMQALPDPDQMRSEIARLVSANPQQTATVIRQWMQQ